MTARRGPRLVTHPGGGYSWAWPDDAANLAEDERIAEIYHQERLKRDAAYAAKRAVYLREVEAGLLADPVHPCPECGEPVYGAPEFCSPECLGASDRRPGATIVRGAHVGAHSASKCPVCARTIPPSLDGQTRIYCSRKCRQRAGTRRFRKRQKDAA